MLFVTITRKQEIISGKILQADKYKVKGNNKNATFTTPLYVFLVNFELVPTLKFGQVLVWWILVLIIFFQHYMMSSEI